MAPDSLSKGAYLLRSYPTSDSPFVLLMHEPSGSSLIFHPGYGLALQSLVLAQGNLPTELLLGTTNILEFEDWGKKMYVGSALFPVANRVWEGKFQFEEKNYQLPINDPPYFSLHGLVFDKTFGLDQTKTDLEEGKVTYSLHLEPSTAIFPSSLLVEIAFQLFEDRFLISSTIKNTGNGPFPWVAGWHPYFSISPKEDYILEMDGFKKLEKGLHGMPTGEMVEFQNGSSLPLASFQADDTFCWTKQNEVSKVSLYNQRKKYEIQLTLGENVTEFPYLQLYTPPLHEAIAIEPMTGAPNAFQNGLGIQTMASGESKTVRFAIALVDGNEFS